MFAEGAVTPFGANIGRGAAYNEVINAVNHRRVISLAVYGHSWGGGATYDLINRLTTDAGAGLIQNPFDIPYTAYIDAVQHSLAAIGAAETRRPPSSQFHVNYYQQIGTPNEFINIHGNTVQGANFELDVNTTLWGSLIDHYTIDDDVAELGIAGRNVLQGVRYHFLKKVNR